MSFFRAISENPKSSARFLARILIVVYLIVATVLAGIGLIDEHRPLENRTGISSPTRDCALAQNIAVALLLMPGYLFIMFGAIVILLVGLTLGAIGIEKVWKFAWGEL